MIGRPARPLLILLLGAFAALGIFLGDLLGIDIPPVLQLAAGAAALVLLWHEHRSGGRAWRLLAWLGGALVLLYLSAWVIALLAWGDW